MQLASAALFLVLPISLVGQGLLVQILLTLCGVACLFGFPGGYTPRYGDHVLDSSHRVALLAGPIGLLTASLCPADQLNVRRPAEPRKLTAEPPCHRATEPPSRRAAVPPCRRAAEPPCRGNSPTFRCPAEPPQVPVALVVLLLPAAVA